LVKIENLGGFLLEILGIDFNFEVTYSISFFWHNICEKFISSKSKKITPTDRQWK